MDQPEFNSTAFTVMLLIMIPIWVVMIWAYVRIVQKAGYSGWNVLWAFVPIANIIAFLYFAFAEWPIVARLRELEQKVFGDAPPPTLGRG
jgi:hypothetical protein